MAATIAQKFKIREGDVLRTLGAPPDFAERLGALPPEARINNRSSNYRQLHWFVKDRAGMEARLAEVLSLLKDGVTCWIYYPKGSSGIQTDLTRDKGWDALQQHPDLQWLSLISFDDTWSAFAFRRKTADDRKKETKPRERGDAGYVDPVTKTVRVPEDLEAAFRKAKKEAAYFQSLAYSHRREYVEWIVSAKKEETRNRRIQETIERLAKAWKNPMNR